MGGEQQIYPTTPEDDEIARLREIICQQDKSVATLTSELRKARADQHAMLVAIGEHARARGEAEGALMVSEQAGIVEGWRTRALAAEAKVVELERGKAAAMGLQQGGSLIIRQLEKRIEELRSILVPFALYRTWARRHEWPADIAEDPSTPVLGRVDYDGGVHCEVTVGHFDRAYWELHNSLEKE